MTNRKPLLFLLILTLALTACQPPNSSPDANNSNDSGLSAGIVIVEGDFDEGHLCNQEFDLGFIDYDAAAQSMTVADDLTTGTLGIAGAQSLIGFTPENTFCGAQISPEHQDILDQVDVMIEEGRSAEAIKTLEDLMQDLLDEAGASVRPPGLALRNYQYTKESARRFILTFLSIAARAQLRGDEDFANEAIAEATDTFTKWATEALKNETDVKEALRIMAEAQLLGLDDMSEEAWSKVQELADKKLEALLERLGPCPKKISELRDILSAAALSQAVGGDSDLIESAVEVVNTAVDNLIAVANGEEPDDEGCGGYFEFEHNMNKLIDFAFLKITAISCDNVNWHVEMTIRNHPAYEITMLGKSSTDIVVDQDTLIGTGKLKTEISFEIYFAVDDTTANWTEPSELDIKILLDGEGGGQFEYIEAQIDNNDNDYFYAFGPKKYVEELNITTPKCVDK